ncbi:MAG: hypothetical protein ABSF52_10090 [Syntrophobacteraceae bacterium]|jgi:hypothetical protein
MEKSEVDIVLSQQDIVTGWKYYPLAAFLWLKSNWFRLAVLILWAVSIYLFSGFAASGIFYYSHFHGNDYVRINRITGEIQVRSVTDTRYQWWETYEKRKGR